MYRHPDEISAQIQPSYLHYDSKGVRQPTWQLLSPISGADLRGHVPCIMIVTTVGFGYATQKLR